MLYHKERGVPFVYCTVTVRRQVSSDAMLRVQHCKMFGGVPTMLEDVGDDGGDSSERG